MPSASRAAQRVHCRICQRVSAPIVAFVRARVDTIDPFSCDEVHADVVIEGEECILATCSGRDRPEMYLGQPTRRSSFLKSWLFWILSISSVRHARRQKRGCI